MGEINYTYRHKDFDLNLAYYYTMVLQVNSTLFTYAVFYNDRLMALAENCILEELVEPTEMVNELLANFKDVVVGVDAEAFTIVPAELYSTDKVAGYARFFDVKEDEKVLAQQLDDDNFIIYKIKAVVFEAIGKFNLDRCVHSSRGWINVIANTNPAYNTIYINIEEGVAELLRFKNGKLRLYNTFEYKTADDLAYAVSVVFKQMGVLQREVHLYLSGAAVNREYRARLSEFFPVVDINKLKIAKLPEELNSGQLLKLSALLLCVSSEAR
ncbi:DUF3822 family protein [Mucilaginibacter calamicampi]|uniref:DUF3822 family protein n=1 Tax=Mucilaginibacter calamicampi TaxID=1302352 RepID=A0ABW2YV95_9SPHI